MLAIFYTSVGTHAVEPDTTLIWGIVVIVAFLLGYASRNDRRPAYTQDERVELNRYARCSFRSDDPDPNGTQQAQSHDESAKPAVETGEAIHEYDGPAMTQPPFSLN